MSVFGQNDTYCAIKETVRRFPDKSTLTMVTDPEKRSCEETMRDAAGKTLRRTVYPLNDQNLRRGVLHYDAKGVLLYKEVYVYDFNGRITESKLFTKDNQPKGKLVFVYDGNNTNARIEDYDEFGNLITPGRQAPPALKLQLIWDDQGHPGLDFRGAIERVEICVLNIFPARLVLQDFCAMEARVSPGPTVCVRDPGGLVSSRAHPWNCRWGPVGFFAPERWPVAPAGVRFRFSAGQHPAG